MAILVNQTSGTTGATINNINDGSGLKPDAYFDKLLLKMLRQVKFHFTKYGVDKKLPRNYGDTINWRRFIKLDPNTTALTEGVTPEGRSISGLSLTAVIKQYGDVLYFTDIVDDQQLDDVKAEYTVELGYLAQETLDLIVRNILVSEGSTFFANGTTDLATLDTAYDTDPTTVVPTVDDFRKITMGMKKAFIKGSRKAKGKYVALVSPETMYDLIDDDKMQKYMDYGNTNRPLVDNMAFSMFGIQWVEVLNAPTVETVTDNGIWVHQSIVIGEQAYAVTKLEGAGVKIIHKGLGSGGATTDALNQIQSIGWKINGFTAKVLNTEAVVVYNAIPSQA